MTKHHPLPAAILLASIVFASSTCPAAAPARPAYAFLRSTEDWSVLANLPGRGEDPFDPVKYIPLSGGAGSWASLGGDLRLRIEDWTNFNFGAPLGVSHDDSFLLTRFRTHADLHFSQTLRLFTEVKGAYASDRNLPGGIRTVDQDKFELQQLFVDLKLDVGDGATLTLRPGRQEYAFGAQRLVSALPWANSLRTWDGLTAILNVHGWNVTAFEAAFVPVIANGVGKSDRDEMIGGLYARHLIKGPGDGIELYALHNDWSKPHTFNGTTGADRRWTVGFRRWAPLSDRADYEIEADYQFGHTGAADVFAWSFASVAGYQVTADKSLRVWAGFDWASGDDGKGGNVQTFSQLYPLGHAYFGAIDMIGRQNIIDVSAGATWKPQPKLTLNFGAHSFTAASTGDAIYNAGGGVVRAGGAYRSSGIGVETDLTAAYALNRHIALDAGYGHFFAGSAIRHSGPSEDIDFLYAGTTFTF
ncbi:MAG TPA: alginate export family protein [Opitutus sp.]|nr:alginate export family protein [Opitutus sp.]